MREVIRDRRNLVKALEELRLLLAMPREDIPSDLLDQVIALVDWRIQVERHRKV